jgi:hypothetical protein
MASHYATYTDARGSNFNTIGRDQNIHQTLNITITGLNSLERALPRVLRDLDGISQWPTSSPEVSSQTEVITQMHPLDAEVNTASSLIDKIEQILVDSTGPPDNNRGLQEELRPLRQTLALTGLAINAYRSTPLGQSLVSSINPEVERCCTVLQELFDSIRSCRQSMFATYIRDLWYHVWWSGWDEDEFASLRMKLLNIRKSLEGLLMALHSYVPFIQSHARLSAKISFHNKCKALSGWMLQTDCAQVMHPSKGSMVY